MIKSHDEKQIFEACCQLMQELVYEFEDYLEYFGFNDQIPEEERFSVLKTNFEIVQKLFLSKTDHSGGTSTREKCQELGLTFDDYQEFKIPDENFN